MSLWWSCQLFVTSVHQAPISKACVWMGGQHRSSPTRPARNQVVINPGWLRTVVTNRQVPHQQPTRVDNHSNRVIVPFKGLLNTSDVARSRRVGLGLSANGSYSVHHRCVIATTKVTTNFLKREAGVFARKPHTHLSWKRHTLVPTLGHQFTQLNVVVPSNRINDLLNSWLR